MKEWAFQPPIHFFRGKIHEFDALKMPVALALATSIWIPNFEALF